MSKNDKSLSSLMLNRRQAVGLGGFAAASTLFIAGCSSGSTDSGSGSTADTAATTEDATVEIDASAYDALIAGGSTADDATIEASTWAKAIKDAGTIRIGGTRTSTLFSLLNEEDDTIRGFDSGLYQLLARYILGDEKKIDLTQVTSDTRESVLQNDQVDAVFATYSITEDRAKVISFAGPYYTSQQGILVMADNEDINSEADLDGKTVAVQSGSTGPEVVEGVAPNATLQEFSTDEEARAALEQGRVDAYVIDITLQLGSMVKNPGKYRLAGDAFGPEDPYGVGLPLDSDGVQFVNDFLELVESEGTWASLWKVCIGDRTGVTTVPDPPAISA